MLYCIMADGEGKRWNNYLGVPKHLVEFNGETLIGRTVRLLKEKGINDIVITSSDDRYNYAKRVPQTIKECEIDRFEETVVEGPVCYLYGDVFYTQDAINTITSTPVKDIMFFGHNYEIFAIKIMDADLFFKHKTIVRNLYMNHKINRCIGWEIYRSLHNIPFEVHKITDRYVRILDGTDDIDYPDDYENFKARISAIKEA